MASSTAGFGWCISVSPLRSDNAHATKHQSVDSRDLLALTMGEPDPVSGRVQTTLPNHGWCISSRVQRAQMSLRLAHRKTVRLKTSKVNVHRWQCDAERLSFLVVVPQAGIEPATFRLEGECSIH